MEITLYLISILFVTDNIITLVTADSWEEAGSYDTNLGSLNKAFSKDDDYYNESPKEYSSEEKPTEPNYNDSDEPNDEDQTTNMDINDNNLNSILDQIIDEINLTEDPKFE